jgi:TonB family protein
MDRLQRKCVVASTALHALPAAILLFGSAFVASRPATGSSHITPPGDRVVQFLPSPPAGVTESKQPSQTSLIEPKAPATEPRERQPAKPSTESFELNHAGATLPRISTNLVERLSGRASGSRPAIPARGPGAQLALAQAIDHLARSLSSTTSIELSQAGDGAGDSSYAQKVKDVYTRNWNPSALGSATEEVTTQVSVTIANDGRVLSATILKTSGDGLADQSVQQLLSAVTSIAPFESGAKEKQRTYTINFHLRAE